MDWATVSGKIMPRPEEWAVIKCWAMEVEGAIEGGSGVMLYP
jgi:hypothetical protein